MEHPQPTVVNGTVAPEFEALREEFAAVVAEEADEPGAQLAVFVGGRQVADLWAGEQMAGDSLHPVYSATKGAAHLVVALLVQEGVLDLDDPVAQHWPEFAAMGTEELTLRELLAHRSGLIGVDNGFTTEELADDRLVAARLVTQHPYWRPGTAYGYHAYVIGALSGEIVRRVTGQSIQELYEELIRGPHGFDFYLGLPPELESRVQPVRPRAPAPDFSSLSADSLMAVAFNLNASPPGDIVAFGNNKTVRSLGPASSGGIASARGMAMMYATAISSMDGHAPLLKPETITEFTRMDWHGVDCVTGEHDHFRIGFESLPYEGLSDSAFGHSGAAGALAFADPAHGLAYAYNRRRFSPANGGAAPENTRLVRAVLNR